MVETVCTSCAATITGCSTCTGANACTLCNTVNNYISDNNGGCICKANFYQDADNICQACPLVNGCLQCSSPGVCKTCDAVNNFIPDPTNTICICN